MTSFRPSFPPLLSLLLLASLPLPAHPFSSPFPTSLVRATAQRAALNPAAPRLGLRAGTRARGPVGPVMEVGDVIDVTWEVFDVQEGLRNAMNDGACVVELEIPTTNRFKDAALNQIYQANTAFAREVVRLFTQPAELCMVFPDAGEAKIAQETYGETPFTLTMLNSERPRGLEVNKYVVMNPVFDVREYIATQELYTNQVQPRDATMILFNADLFKLRSSGITGYYPDFFFPKLAKSREIMMPDVITGFYFRVFRGPPVGALYRKYPGPWQVLRAVEDGQFKVLFESNDVIPPQQNFVLTTLQQSI